MNSTRHGNFHGGDIAETNDPKPPGNTGLSVFIDSKKNPILRNRGPQRARDFKRFTVDHAHAEVLKWPGVRNLAKFVSYHVAPSIRRALLPPFAIGSIGLMRAFYHPT